MIKLYNSLTQQIELFTPNTQGQIGMYVCGITPYDTTHLGHAFTYIHFDVLYRVLEALGNTVNYTQNVTDIDDDILKRAKRDSQDWKELGIFWTEKFQKDLKQLNTVKPTHYVKATDTMKTIIQFVTKLVKDGYAYESKGNVYFDVAKDPTYGKLSHLSEREMITLSKDRGADPDDPRKKHPLDFILWQKSLPDEPSWNSPWSWGRPGWHIECSAMAYKYIDKKVDIHGGGIDLIYPHHESEIAQSEHFTGEKPFVQIWMHTGAVAYQGEKMSKSLGNLVLVSDLLKTYSANAIRYMLLSNHYRSPWEYTEKDIEKAATSVKNIEKALESTPSETVKNVSVPDSLLNDLGTPKALQEIEQCLHAKQFAEAKDLWMLLGFNEE